MRWITFSSLFPNAVFPERGVFVRERLRAVLRRARGQAVVVAPVPWFPPLIGFGGWSRWARVPRFERAAGLQVYHPRYPLAPKVSTSFHPLLLQAGAARTVGRLAPGACLLDAHYLYPDGVAAVRIGRRLRLPVVLTARGSDVNVLGRLAAPRRWIRRSLPRAAAVIAVSGDLRRRLAEQAEFPEERIELVPNGIDRAAFHPDDRAAARAACGLPLDERILLAAGNLVPPKRFDLLLEALARLEPAQRPLLVCVGDGPDRSRLERRARRAGIRDRVRFVGRQAHPAMPRWYAAADAFALASDAEGNPNVLLEAIACGIPVLASSVGGVPEIVDAEVGHLVAPNTPEAFARGIQELARRRFDPTAFDNHASLHSWDAVGAKLAALFERIAASPTQSE